MVTQNSCDFGTGTSGQVLTSNGTGVAPTFQPVSASGAVTTIDGNTGAATGSTITLVTANSTPIFAASGSSVTLDFSPANFNLALGSSLPSLSGGSSNVSLGHIANASISSGTTNIAVGTSALTKVSSGAGNVGVGDSAASSLTTGSRNIAIGLNSASAYTSSEANNIVISNAGVIGDANTIYLGTQGSGNSQQNKCFIAGIAGVSVSNQTIVTQNSSTNQMGAVTTVPVANGGTGAATLTGILTGNGTSAVTANAVTQHGVLIGGASNAASSLGVAATGTVLAGATGADPAFTATPSVTSITLSSGTALSNYVEGTFTPTVVGLATTGTATYVTQSGVYTRIGRQLFYYITVSWNTGTGTGQLAINGLPFTVNASCNNAITTSLIYTVGVATSTNLYGIPIASNIAIPIYYNISATGVQGNVTYAAAGAIEITGMYYI